MIKPKRPPFATTKISAQTSQSEIHNLLKTYGADGICWTEERGKVTLEFYVDTEIDGIAKQLMVRLNPPPFEELRRVWDRNSNRYVKKSFPNDAVSMRLLWHYLQIKLALVAWGVRPFEEEFLAEINIRTEEGPRRFADWVKEKNVGLLLPEIEVMEKKPE